MGFHLSCWTSLEMSRGLERLLLAYVQRCTKYVQRKQHPESGTTGINRKLQQTSSCGSQSRSNPLRFVCHLTCSMLLAANLPIISSECIPKDQASPLQHDREATNPRLPNFHHICSWHFGGQFDSLAHFGLGWQCFWLVNPELEWSSFEPGTWARLLSETRVVKSLA